MGVATIRNIPDAVHDALRAQAKSNHRSVEAELRVILENAVVPANRRRMGDELSTIAREAELTDADMATLEAEQ